MQCRDYTPCLLPRTSSLDRNSKLLKDILLIKDSERAASKQETKDYWPPPGLLTTQTQGEVFLIYKVLHLQLFTRVLASSCLIAKTHNKQDCVEELLHKLKHCRHRQTVCGLRLNGEGWLVVGSELHVYVMHGQLYLRYVFTIT